MHFYGHNCPRQKPAEGSSSCRCTSDLCCSGITCHTGSSWPSSDKEGKSMGNGSYQRNKSKQWNITLSRRPNSSCNCKNTREPITFCYTILLKGLLQSKITPLLHLRSTTPRSEEDDSSPPSLVSPVVP